MLGLAVISTTMWLPSCIAHNSCPDPNVTPSASTAVSVTSNVLVGNALAHSSGGVTGVTACSFSLTQVAPALG